MEDSYSQKQSRQDSSVLKLFTTKTLAEVHSMHAIYVIVPKINNGYSHIRTFGVFNTKRILCVCDVLNFVHHDFIFNLLFSHTNIHYKLISSVHLMRGSREG